MSTATSIQAPSPMVASGRRGRALSAASSSRGIGATQPKIPPCAADHLQRHPMELGEVGADAVLEHQALEAAVVRLPDGRVHAHLGRHAGHDQARDLARCAAAAPGRWRRSCPSRACRGPPRPRVGELVDDVVAVLAPDEDPSLRPRTADPIPRAVRAPACSAGSRSGRAGDLRACARPSSRRPGPPPAPHASGSTMRAEQRDVVAEQLAEPTGLEEVPLHVDHHQRGARPDRTTNSYGRAATVMRPPRHHGPGRRPGLESFHASALQQALYTTLSTMDGRAVGSSSHARPPVWPGGQISAPAA